jgi:hypothetical protein
MDMETFSQLILGAGGGTLGSAVAASNAEQKKMS